MKLTMIGAPLALGFTLVSSAVSAADVSSDASRWGGGYIGAYGSFTELDAKYSDSRDGHIGARLDDANSNEFDAYGGGVHAGYNFINDALLLGGEVYAEQLGAKGCVNTSEASDEPTSCPYGHSVETEVSQSIGVNGKIGFASSSLLVYGLAGINFSKIKSTFNDWTFSGDDSIYESEFDAYDTGSGYEFGWRIGGGAEYSLSENISMFAQGSYTRLNASLKTPNVSNAENIAMDENEPVSKLETKLGIVAINVGLNFRF